MIDYFSLLTRAVQSIDKNTKGARRSVYGCARTILTDSLRSTQPTLSELEVTDHLSALEEAIRRVESEQLGKDQLLQSTHTGLGSTPAAGPPPPRSRAAVRAQPGP